MALDYASPLARRLMFYWPLVPSSSVAGIGPAFTTSKGRILRQLVPRTTTGLSTVAAINGAMSYVPSGGADFSPVQVRVDPRMGPTVHIRAAGDKLVNAETTVKATNVGNVWTASLWVKPISKPTTQASLLNHQQPSFNNVNLAIDLDTTGGPQVARVFYTVGSFNFKIAVGTRPVPNGSWSHIVGLSDGAVTKLYVNGKFDLAGTGGGTNTTTSFEQWQIGLGAGLVCQVQNVAVWNNRALTAGEVRNLYARPWQMVRAVRGQVIVP